MILTPNVHYRTFRVITVIPANQGKIKPEAADVAYGDCHLSIVSGGQSTVTILRKGSRHGCRALEANNWAAGPYFKYGPEIVLTIKLIVTHFPSRMTSKSLKIGFYQSYHDKI